jgi:hypothetical protein
MKWWQIDPSAYVIRMMEKCGLAREVVRISQERQEKRRIQGVGTTEGDLLPGLSLTPEQATAVAAATTVASAVAQVAANNSSI